MKCSSLNLDTHYNIFCCESSLHQFFDQNQWLLLPEDCVVKKYRESLSTVGDLFYALRDHLPDFPICLLIMFNLSF